MNLNRLRTWNRISAFSLALMLLVSICSAHAGWECLDGSPCPPNCSLHVTPTPVANAHSAHCSLCPEPSVKISSACIRCKSSTCIYRTSQRPLAQKPLIHELSMEVSLPERSHFVSRPIAVSVAYYVPGNLRPPPEYLLALHSPRGPPNNFIIF